MECKRYEQREYLRKVFVNHIWKNHDQMTKVALRHLFTKSRKRKRKNKKTQDMLKEVIATSACFRNLPVVVFL